MERTACVDIPALPLQLLLRAEPALRSHPAVIVADDRPQGVVLWANPHARRVRILPGMTFAAARNLASDLRAAVVPPERIEAAVDELVRTLCNFTPRVEPARGQPGVFFVDPTGLVPLYGSLEHWASCRERI
jgi:protein ImuB